MKDFFRSIVRLIRANEMYRGGYGFFLKKYSDFGGGKKKSDSEFLSYNLMLNSGKKNCALRDKKINILTLVLSEKKILNETINHTLPSPPSPFKLNDRSLMLNLEHHLFLGLVLNLNEEILLFIMQIVVPIKALF